MPRPKRTTPDKSSSKKARSKVLPARKRESPAEGPQEFPISRAILRRIYDSMIESRLYTQSRGIKPTISEATAVAAALAVKSNDIFAAPADGQTLYPIPHQETVVAAYSPSAMRKTLLNTLSRHRHAIALALMSEQELDSRETGLLLSEAHDNSWPIIFVALTDRPFDPSAAVIELDVDGHDAVAVFRVISESVRRARNGRGPAVIHAHGLRHPLSSRTVYNPLERFECYLNAKGLSTEDIHVLHRE